MRIGASILTFYLGMILTSIRHAQPAGLNLRTTGITLMIVGIGTLFVTCVLWARGPKAARAEPPPGDDTDLTVEPRAVHEDPTGLRPAEDELASARPVTPGSGRAVSPPARRVTRLAEVRTDDHDDGRRSGSHHRHRRWKFGTKEHDEHRPGVAGVLPASEHPAPDHSNTDGKGTRS